MPSAGIIEYRIIDSFEAGRRCDERAAAARRRKSRSFQLWSRSRTRAAGRASASF